MFTMVAAGCLRQGKTPPTVQKQIAAPVQPTATQPTLGSFAAIAGMPWTECSEPKDSEQLCACLKRVSSLEEAYEQGTEWRSCEIDEADVPGWGLARLSSTYVEAAVLVRRAATGWIGIKEVERSSYSGQGDNNSHSVDTMRLQMLATGAVLIIEHSNVERWFNNDYSSNDGQGTTEGGSATDSVTLCPYRGGGLTTCLTLPVQSDDPKAATFRYSISDDGVLTIKQASGNLNAEYKQLIGRHRIFKTTEHP